MYGFKVGSEIQTQIYLNIYDLNPGFNQTCYKLGLGFFHTGIQISSTQYTFGYHEGSQTGVMEVTPKVNHPDFRESILLGTTSVPPHKIKSIIGQLKGKFPGNSYHIIRKNCNTFTNCVCQALLHKNIPYFVNRLANVTKSFMQIGDFIMMKPYDLKYEVSAKQFGIQAERSVFEKGQGVTIG